MVADTVRCHVATGLTRGDEVYCSVASRVSKELRRRALCRKELPVSDSLRSTRSIGRLPRLLLQNPGM